MMLNDCVETLAGLTGHLEVRLSWTSKQSSPDIRLSGFRILVNGIQFGRKLGPKMKNTRFKLEVNENVKRISMVSSRAAASAAAEQQREGDSKVIINLSSVLICSLLNTQVSLCDVPKTTSIESDAVEILTSSFKPFSFFCLHAIHRRGIEWPMQGK